VWACGQRGAMAQPLRGQGNDPGTAVDAASIAVALRSPELCAARDGLARLEAALYYDTAARPDQDAVGVACACVGALASFVGRGDLEVADFRRASLRMQSLLAMDRAILRCMFAQGHSDTFWELYDAPMGGLALAMAKPPSDLNLDDAFNVACQMASVIIFWGWGATSFLPAVGGQEGISAAEALANEQGIFIAAEGKMGFSSTPFSMFNKMCGGTNGATDETIERLALLMLELLRSSGQQGQAPLPTLVEIGVWGYFCEAYRARPASMAQALMEAGILEYGVQQLKTFAPMQFCKRVEPIPAPGIHIPRGDSGIPNAILMGLKDLVLVCGGLSGELFTRMLQLGYWEVIVDTMRAFAMLGERGVSVICVARFD
jgi:hypothetical protein